MLTLRQARTRANLGLERSARAADTDVRSLIRIEKGRQQPGIAVAARIARALDIPVNRVEEFLPAVREVEAAGFVLADTNGHKDSK